MLELKNKAMNSAAHTNGDEFKMKILIKLKKLEAEMLKVKGKKREKAMKTYRELLAHVEEEPIYLKRYE